MTSRTSNDSRDARVLRLTVTHVLVNRSPCHAGIYHRSKVKSSPQCDFQDDDARI